MLVLALTLAHAADPAPPPCDAPADPLAALFLLPEAPAPTPSVLVVPTTPEAPVVVVAPDTTVPPPAPAPPPPPTEKSKKDDDCKVGPPPAQK